MDEKKFVQEYQKMNTKKVKIKDIYNLDANFGNSDLEEEIEVDCISNEEFEEFDPDLYIVETENDEISNYNSNTDINEYQQNKSHTLELSMDKEGRTYDIPLEQNNDSDINVNNSSSEHDFSDVDPTFDPNDTINSQDSRSDINDSEKDEREIVNEKANDSGKEVISGHNITNNSDTSGINVSINMKSVSTAIKDSLTPVLNCQQGPKRYTCKICNAKIIKFAEHLTTVHKDLPEIIELNKITPEKRKKNTPLNEKQLKRLEIINKFRKESNFEHNMNTNTGSEFVPAHRPKLGVVKLPKEYRPCPNCKDFYLKRTLHRHVAKCANKSFKHNHIVQSMSKKTLGDIHISAQKSLIQILSHLVDDEVSEVLKHDEAIIYYGNILDTKHQYSEHLGKMIRARLRGLGRLLLEMRKLSDQITDFSSILSDEFFDLFIQACKNLSNYNEETLLMANPATADSIGMHTKECCELWIIQCKRKKWEKKLKNAEDFLYSYKQLFNKLISSIVAESQAELKKAKKVKLPSLDDIKSLYIHLNNERRAAFNELKELSNRCFVTYKKLVDTTVLSIQLFNRRRAGEIERLKRSHYESLDYINENTCPEVYEALNENAKRYVHRYARILIRGKRNRTVPILLTREFIDCIELIIKCRKDLHISSKNPYVFSFPSTDKREHKHASACDAMRLYANECGANIPNLLRGTLLRKHVATTCISLNLSEVEIEHLANFMGHSDKIHKDIYRQPLAKTDIVDVAKLLEKAQGIYDELDDNVYKPIADSNLAQVNNNQRTVIESEHDEDDETIEPRLDKQKGKNRIGRINVFEGASTKKKWDATSKQAVLAEFETKLRNKQFPSGQEIHDFLQSTPIRSLKNRTVPQVRTWLHLQKKNLASDECNTAQRNTIPNSIYVLFKKNILEKQKPSNTEISKAMTSSPIMEKFTVAQVRSFVDRAILLHTDLDVRV